jgi:dolichyl-phosphate beta-glucosyltransferase
MLDISIVIPTYNEAHRLPKTLAEIRSWLDNRKAAYEVIIVDDDSRDGTAEFVLKLSEEWGNIKLLRQNKRLGKGASVSRGCLEAEGRIILFMDADHAVLINELGNFFPYFDEGYEIVVGVRTFQEDVGRFRRVMGLMQMVLAHLLVFKKAVSDSQCGFKSFSHGAARRIFEKSRIKRGMIDVEIFYLAHKYDLKIYQQPVHYVHKQGSVINVFKCMLVDPIDMIRIRLNDWLKKYG